MFSQVPTSPDHQPSFISFLHLLWSITFSLFKLRAWQFFAQPLSKSSGLPLGLEPSTSYSIHLFNQSLSSFRNTCPYHCNLFCCTTEIMSSNPSLSTLYLEMSHISWPFSYLPAEVPPHFLTGQVSLSCNILLHTQVLYSLPLIINDTSILVSSGTKCLNLFYPIRILASTAASSSPSTLNMLLK